MEKLIIDVLSDTHNKHPHFNCPGGDIILHSGDVSGRGSDEEIMNFIIWFSTLPYKHKIFIPGNHDFSLERNFAYWFTECANRGITLLNDSGITVEGIKIWGSPVQPWFHSWAFNRARTLEEATTTHPWIKNHWDLIPDDTEILLTHGPPMGILDEVTMVNGDSFNPPRLVGCEELLAKIERTQVKLHVFGHIHEGAGFIYKKEVTFVNASSLDRMYMPIDNKPVRVTREVFQDGSIGYVL